MFFCEDVDVKNGFPLLFICITKFSKQIPVTKVTQYIKDIFKYNSTNIMQFKKIHVVNITRNDAHFKFKNNTSSMNGKSMLIIFIKQFKKCSNKVSFC